MERVAIVGCGWLGLPLAKRLLEKGYAVSGSTTSREKLSLLEQQGIRPFWLQATPSGLEGQTQVFQADTLILNIPPGRRNPSVENDYPASIAHLMHAVEDSPIKRLLFIGSTSVYAESQGQVTEQTPPQAERNSGKALLKAETLIQQGLDQISILRFGGLVGPERQAARFLAGRKNLSGGELPVNLIHQADCIDIICEIVQQQQWGFTWNACSDAHPTRKAFYTKAAEVLGLAAPHFREEKGIQSPRVIDNTFLKESLDYTFVYPSPFDML